MRGKRTTARPRNAAPSAPDSPVWRFAAALNPDGGALRDALPFTLTAEDARPRPKHQQPGLLDDTEREQ